MLPKDVHYTYDKQVRLNSLGFRGPEIREKQVKEYRIIALGDSHIYGQGLQNDSLLTTILHAGLNSPDQACFFNVINMGVRAYSINNELAVLKKFGISLEPDHVILFFYINDFQKTNIEQRYQQHSNKDWYTFDLSDKPGPEVVRKWNHRQLLRKSAFIMWAHDIYTGIVSSDNLENRLLAGIVDDGTRNAKRFVYESLGELVRLSREYEFSVTLAVVPVAAQVERDFPDENYQSTLKQFASQYSIDFVDMLPMLRNDYERSGTLPVIPFDGHYNREGQKALGIGMLEHLHSLAVGCEH